MSDPLLSVSGLSAGYGKVEVLRGIDLEVAAEEIVAVLGANGAGKSTLNRAISGVLRTTHGSIRFAGSAIEHEKPATIVARGLIHVPEGRCVFPNLTTNENLDLGSYRFFFNDTATTEIYTLSLHDALPICRCWRTRSSTSAGETAATRAATPTADRKSTRLNSSHVKISYAVFCLKKKK